MKGKEGKGGPGREKVEDGNDDGWKEQEGGGLRWPCVCTGINAVASDQRPRLISFLVGQLSVAGLLMRGRPGDAWSGVLADQAGYWSLGGRYFCFEREEESLLWKTGEKMRENTHILIQLDLNN